jgi:hypothetical protein
MSASSSTGQPLAPEEEIEETFDEGMKVVSIETELSLNEEEKARLIFHRFVYLFHFLFCYPFGSHLTLSSFPFIQLR